MQDLIFSYDLTDTFTPLDGRNRHKLQSLSPYLSELALTKYRVQIEVAYLQKLSTAGVIRKISAKENAFLTQLCKNLSQKDYKRIRVIEQATNHEMKSVEEFIKEILRKTTLKDIADMVHFGLTSDDINNLAYALMIQDTVHNCLQPEIQHIASLLLQKAKTYKSIPMLARTHGQPAVPTTVGKEFLVFYKRLSDELKILSQLKINGKLMGNTGNLNAHKVIFPKIDWLKFSKEFVTSLKLTPDQVVTQIEPYDSLIRIFQSLVRINNILEGLCKDMWIYISMHYFSQKLVTKEVGSTALPHKVNPIYFEGAEGGFAIATSLFELYARKLSYTRLQRDMSDSTVRRSIGIAFCYSFLSYQSMNEALSRIEPNNEIISQDLSHHWEVLSEVMQNFLRSKKYTDAYDKTKLFFRGKIFTQKDVAVFINSLAISQKDKAILLELSPDNYTGYAEKIVDIYGK